MKNILKKLILILLYYSFRNRQHSGLLVLTYHRISNVPDYEDPLKVSKKTFEKQIQYLKRNYKLISGEDLFKIIKNKISFPENSCLITFDDGWSDNYKNAYPVLKKYDIPAIIFVSTDFIGTNNIFWHEQLQELLNNIPAKAIDTRIEKLLTEWSEDIINLINDVIQQPKSKRQLKINELISKLKIFDPEKINKLINGLSQTYNQKLIGKPLVLTWNEIREMSKNKISFGSHTKSHAILTQIDEKQAIEELVGSKKIIEDKLNMPVSFLSYPNGNYNKTIIKIAEQANYHACFSCISGVNNTLDNLFFLKRQHIKEYSSLGFDGKFSELLFKVDLANVRNYLREKTYIL